MWQVVCIAVFAVMIFAGGVFMEHYLGPQPKLDTEELFQAFDLIDVQCEWEYTRVRAMRQELWLWMHNPKAQERYLCQDLQHVIKTVKAVDEVRNE